jgi:hypothetical protein
LRCGWIPTQEADILPGLWRQSGVRCGSSAVRCSADGKRFLPAQPPEESASVAHHRDRQLAGTAQEMSPAPGTLLSRTKSGSLIADENLPSNNRVLDGFIISYRFHNGWYRFQMR